MKKIIALLAIAFITAVGYCIYLGVAKSENNNAGMIAMDASNLAQSVTDTFKDGAVILAAQAKELQLLQRSKQSLQLTILHSLFPARLLKLQILLRRVQLMRFPV